MKQFLLPLTVALLAAVAVPAGAQVLVDRYSFTNGVTDSVGSRNGTLGGTATVSSGALQLSGGSHLTAYATLPISSVITGNTNLTIEAWFTATASAGFAKVFMFGQDTSNFFCYTPAYGSGGPGRVEFEQGGAYVPATSPSSPTLNVEHEMAAVYNGTGQSVSYYLDGTLLGTATESAPPTPFTSSGSNYLGASIFNDPDFAGSIDEFRIYTGALTGTQISQNYAAGPNMVAIVPEPSTWALLGLGGAGLVRVLLRRRPRAA